MTMPRIGICVCTYLRPVQLGHLIAMFERQTYENRYMVILDDAGQYQEQRGDRWELHSVSGRFGSLGEKRNACAAMAAEAFPETTVFAVADDDDFYLKWHLEMGAVAMKVAEWSVPSTVLHLNRDGTFRQHYTGPGTFYHGGMLYTRELFDRVGGYPPWSGNEDAGLFRKFEAAGASVADPVALSDRPSGYCWMGDHPAGVPHISGMLTGKDHGEPAWQRMGALATEASRDCRLKIELPPGIDFDDPTIHPELLPRPF